MAYSYIEIPPMPIWDSTSYPYLVIFLHYDVGADRWNEAYAYYSSSPYTYGPGDKLVCHTEQEGMQKYDGIGWSYVSDMEFWPSELWSLNLGLSVGYDRVWTNHDIYDDDYDLYLEANSVNPIGWRGLKDWIRGLVIGTAVMNK